MTQAVVAALQNELRQDRKTALLPDRLRALGEKAKAMTGPRAREMTRDAIDELNGP
jgi:hypothetical protein